MIQFEESLLQEIEELYAAKNYVALKELFGRLEPVDIALIVGRVEPAVGAALFRMLPKEAAAEVFAELEAEEQEFLIEGLSDRELKGVVDGLFSDDAADLVEEMPAYIVKRILRHTDPDKRAIINQLLKYPKNSAGSIMTVEYIALHASYSVREAFERIRKKGLRSETIYTCYVIDANRKLEGVVTIRDLLLAEPEELLGSMMNPDIVCLNTLDEREQVVHAFDKYDFLALPVVDAERRLVGIVTVDDAMDAMQDENTADIEMMAAIVPTEKSYLKTNTWETFMKRIPWLLVLMVSATFTGRIIAGFESALAAEAVLISFIPMLMDTGGNSGSQASVTVIRSLSLGELRFSDIFRVLWKELRVSVLCGVVLAAANFAKIMLLDNLLLHAGISVSVAAIICLTLLCTVTVAKLVGCSLPMLAKKCGFDPAVMASPLITTVVDALSLLVYFAFATALLGL